MFNKISSAPTPPFGSAPSAPALAERPSAQPVADRHTSVIGAELVFEGSITGEGELMIDGAVKGDVHVSRLVIGEQAHVEGALRGSYIEVRGRVIGNIEGKAVRLLESAHVEGDITHEQLSIEVGAFFQGRCAQFRPAPQHVVEAQPALQASAPHAQAVGLDLTPPQG